MNRKIVVTWSELKNSFEKTWLEDDRPVGGTDRFGDGRLAQYVVFDNYDRNFLKGEEEEES